MKLKRIVSATAAAVMAISVMSIGASASSWYTNIGHADAYNELDPTQVCTVFQMRANTWGQYEYTLSHVYVKAVYSSPYGDLQGAAGCDSAVSGATSFATLIKNSDPQAVSDDVTYGNGIVWTSYKYFGNLYQTGSISIYGRGTVYY